MLNIRDKRVQALARELADLRGVTMTQAVRESLEKELAKESVSKRLLAIGRRCAASAGPGGRVMNKDEIDDMWTR
jgi:hypothetical protein